MTSSFEFLNFEIASTCFPIKYSEFLPEINDKNKRAFAFLVICVTSPGNNTIGSLVCFLISKTKASVIISSTSLPPTKIWVAIDEFTFLIKSETFEISNLSGSIKTANNLLPLLIDFNMLS